MPLSLASTALHDVVGIALTFQTDGSWRADICALSRQRDVVVVLQQEQDLTSAEALAQALGPEPRAMALVLAGRGVLFRNLPGSLPASAAARAELLATALPGVNPTDFYIQYQPGERGTQVALVRRQLVDPLLAEWQAAGLWVVALRLGPYDFATLLPYLPAAAKQPVLTVGNFQVHLAAATDAIDSVDYNPAPVPVPGAYTLGKDVFSSAQVLPYAAGLAALVSPAATDVLPAVPPVQERRTEWGYRLLYLRLRLAVPVVILVLLLANFFTSQSLADEQSRLSDRLGNNEQLLEQVRKLQQTTGLKHQFLTSTGWAQPSWNSVCADRLAASMPSGLNLLDLTVAPPQTTGGVPERVSDFQPDLVSVKGQCRDSQQFNAWLQRITKLAWVRAVRDQNFTYDYATGVGTFTFTLVIKPAALLL